MGTSERSFASPQILLRQREHLHSYVCPQACMSSYQNGRIHRGYSRVVWCHGRYCSHGHTPKEEGSRWKGIANQAKRKVPGKDYATVTEDKIIFFDWIRAGESLIIRVALRGPGSGWPEPSHPPDGSLLTKRHVATVSLLASHQRRFGFNPRPGHSGFSHVGIGPDVDVGRRVFSGISRFSRPFIPILTLLTLTGSQTSMLRAVRISSLTRTKSLFLDRIDGEDQKLELFSDKNDTATCIKCVIAPTRRALNRTCSALDVVWLRWKARLSFVSPTRVGEHRSGSGAGPHTDLQRGADVASPGDDVTSTPTLARRHSCVGVVVVPSVATARASSFGLHGCLSGWFCGLARSPPIKADRVQFPGHRIVASGNRAGRCRWSVGFPGDLPFHPPLHSGAALYSLQSPLSALKTSRPPKSLHSLHGRFDCWSVVVMDVFVSGRVQSSMEGFLQGYPKEASIPACVQARVAGLVKAYARACTENLNVTHKHPSHPSGGHVIFNQSQGNFFPSVKYFSNFNFRRTDEWTTAF
ncbi:hypothetical protein PR048_008038 [Dryococelus australis]|uniref:Uncharacterized protein n=1 Tax=Dryococelus australis TaxID=614101 RepID=A0ABQ9HW97_9NEOP|nr:hypothetical protein PR048_008038 [Dryococelus australis]